VKVEKRVKRKSFICVDIVGFMGMPPSSAPVMLSFVEKKFDNQHGRRPLVRLSFCCEGFVEGQFVIQ